MIVFFFKQKTAYEMRISDWSSDVCSSDLGVICEHYGGTPRRPECEERTPQSGAVADLWDVQTGRRLWSIAGTAYDFSQTYRPTISPDGRYALVSMPVGKGSRSEEHTSELQSLMRISYAVFCLKKKKQHTHV